MSGRVLAFNGIDGSTGEPLDAPPTAKGLVREVVGSVGGIGAGRPDDHAIDLKSYLTTVKEPHLSPMPNVDPTDLAQAGWGVIFAQDEEDAVRAALAELLEHRKRQATHGGQ